MVYSNNLLTSSIGNKYQYILFVFVVLLNTQCLGQAPGYFDNDPRWRQNSSCAGPLPCLINSEYICFVAGDTLINNITYKILRKSGISNFVWMGGAPPPASCIGSNMINEVAGFVRQQNKKVFIYNNTLLAEELLYDFNLNIGDTMPESYNHDFNNYLIVSSIDSLPTSSGFRKKFLFNTGSTPYVIEGIGHQGGFIEPIPPIFDCGYNLECYTINDTAYYPAQGINCDVTVSVQFTLSSPKVKYYPNPVAKILTIESDQNNSLFKKIKVFSHDGKQLQVAPISQSNNSKFEIDFATAADGNYIIYIYFIDGNSTSFSVNVALGK